MNSHGDVFGEVVGMVGFPWSLELVEGVYELVVEEDSLGLLEFEAIVAIVDDKEVVGR